MAARYTVGHTLSMRGDALPKRQVMLADGTVRTESALTPRRVSGREGIGELFEYRVEALAPVSPMFYDKQALAQIELNRIAGTEVTLAIDLEGIEIAAPDMRAMPAFSGNGAGTREISGVVESAAVLGLEGSALLFELVIRPWCWLATLSTNSRNFNGPIIDILHDVLHVYPGTIEWRINGMENPQRDYIRQAWETDWHFFQRLCEEFGFVSWFEHQDGTHILVVADNPGAYRTHDRACAVLRYHTGGGHINEEHIAHLSFASAVTPGKVTVSDHSYLSPRLRKSALPYREEYDSPGDTENAHHEIYTRADYAQPRTRADVLQDDTNWRHDARFLARVQMEALRCPGLRARGSGHLRGIESGKTFTLTHHPLKTANRDYLVTCCTLDIREMGGTSETMHEYTVDASFDLHPLSEPYRMPQITPRPRIDGCEEAVIVGPRDAEMYVDEHNRVLIQCSWDRAGGFDGRKSIWVRVAAAWQGDQMGVAVHGRCGQQVLVKYANGDPDRPYIAAFVVDRDNRPAWKLPDNRALTGIVTRSLGHGTTSNHLALDDTENRQQAQLASDHAKSSLSLGYITRIEGNAGRQDARGEGFELRSDQRGAVRAPGLLLTTIAKIGAVGKVLDMGETIARLARSRDIHESLARQAQRHGAQNPTGDQSDVPADMQRANAELRGKLNAGRDEFPEFDAPHMTLSSSAGIQTAAAGSTHIASDEHTALTTGGHVSIASGKSFFASVREKIALYAQKAIAIVTPGRVHVESRTADLRLLAQEVVEIISQGDWIRLASPSGIELKGGDSVLRISPEGITGYTGGRFLVHAADHATDDPVSKPVDFPVTPENPGKLAAHHVLVENGGGFAVPNQPYRLTLDDGQVIEGATNALGELQIATSNAVSFGVIELMSQTTQGDVIGVTNVTVYADASRAPVSPDSVPARRTTIVGGKTTSTPDESATSQGKQPEYFSCDALNYGLRRYRFLKGATAEDTPVKYHRRDNIEYPVAKAYTAAIKTALEAIDWVRLAAGPSGDFSVSVASAIQPPLWAALQDGAFGLPADSIYAGGCMPAVKIVEPEEYPKYGMTPDYAGGFISEYWVIAINKTRMDWILRYATPLADKSLSEKNLDTARKNLSETLRDFANTLYHESRHCQQRYWMISLFYTYRGDYGKFKALEICYKNTVNEIAFELAKTTTFPADDLAKIGMHRMLVFDYYWRINGKGPTTNPNLAPVLDDQDSVEKEVCELLNITPEVAKLMVDKDKGYRSHLHEEDAWTCGELVDSYWLKPAGHFRVNPGTCTQEYERTFSGIGGKPNA